MGNKPLPDDKFLEYASQNISLLSADEISRVCHLAHGHTQKVKISAQEQRTERIGSVFQTIRDIKEAVGVTFVLCVIAITVATTLSFHNKIDADVDQTKIETGVCPD